MTPSTRPAPEAPAAPRRRPPARTFELRDGSRVTVRPVRTEDKALLRAGFERLSPESRYRRFLTPMPKLSERLVRYFTEVDHHDHEALVALDGEGNGVGVARFVRALEPEVAEAAVTVVDDWQGRGLGTALLTMLANRARAEGVRRFSALMLAQNDDMLDLLRNLGEVRLIDRDQGTIEVEVSLPKRGIGSRLRRMLRGTAAGDFELRPRHPQEAATGVRDLPDAAGPVRA